jgi:RNA polymerase subunit RPABC4/transcription elongation factor Spt4
LPEYFPFFLRLIAALAGGAIAHSKGREKFGWGVACFVFPPLIIAVLLLGPRLAAGKTKRCPHCSRIIYRADITCRYCGRELPIELVQCRHCGNFVPEKDYCVQCHRKM